MALVRQYVEQRERYVGVYTNDGTGETAVLYPAPYLARHYELKAAERKAASAEKQQKRIAAIIAKLEQGT